MGEQDSRIWSAFTRALNLEGQDREAFLQQLHQENGEVFAEVCNLLENQGNPDLLKSRVDLQAFESDEAGPTDGPPNVKRPAERGKHEPSVHSPTPLKLKQKLTQWPNIPGYEILENIGVGGMGVVYKARQRQLNRTVAIKMIQGGYSGERERIRFQLEGEAVAKLSHPHIVQVFQIGEIEDQPFFSMEYCSGGSLNDRLKSQSISFTESAILITHLAEAMAHAHGRGVIHRDLKPHNIMFTETGVAKIADFGLVKFARHEESELTLDGQLLGTPAYTAPEQTRADGDTVGPGTDLWALGVILYRMLTGQLPFLGDTREEVMLAVQSAEPVAPRRLNASIPKDLETICLKCLQKNSDNRYSSALEFSEDLKRFSNHEPIKARPVGHWEWTMKWCRRNPGSTVAMISILVLFLFLIPGSLLLMLALEQQSSAEALAKKEKLLRQAKESEAKAAKKSQEEAIQRALLAKKLAATEHYNAIYTQIGSRSLTRPLGWTWKNLKDLQHLTTLDVSHRNDYDLRCEAVRCLSAMDIRQKAILFQKHFEIYL